MHTELGFEEHRTAKIVCERLAAFGIEHHSGIGKREWSRSFAAVRRERLPPACAPT
jgi:metal-dependent amidase/aminoacylase/carboxypeptidase family protein